MRTATDDSLEVWQALRTLAGAIGRRHAAEKDVDERRAWADSWGHLRALADGLGQEMAVPETLEQLRKRLRVEWDAMLTEPDGEKHE